MTRNLLFLEINGMVEQLAEIIGGLELVDSPFRYGIAEEHVIGQVTYQ